jgi:hypothetical protein
LHHPPSRMKAVLVTWVHRPRVCGTGRSSMMNWTTFRDSGHSQRKMQCAHNPRAVNPQPIEKPTSADLLPDDTQTHYD